MTVAPFPPKNSPKKKPSFFTYVIVSVFAALIIIRGMDLIDGVSAMYRKHHVQIFQRPVDINSGQINDLSNVPYIIKDFNGKMAILAFWAPWCRFCATELPQMDSLQPALAQRGINIIPIVKNTEPMENIRGFYTEHKLNDIPPYISGDRTLYGKLGVSGFPMFFLVDSKGNAVASMRPNWTADDALEMIDDLTAKINAPTDPASSLNP